MLNITMLELEAAAKILRKKRVVSNADNFDVKQHKFNCWCFTAFILGWTRKFKWFGVWEMEDLLTEKSYPIKRTEIRAGDIVVYRSGRGRGSLAHTALIIDAKKKTILHKDGSSAVEMSKISEPYSWCSRTFRRPKKRGVA